MGYLDHSTNNIILDAVLTDFGRQKLSSPGKFNIAKFSLGDDEVDYTLVKKYGRTVGKEKIEKNTPIFEALTNQSVSLKFKLVGTESSVTTSSTAYMPILTYSPDGSIGLTQRSNSSVVSFSLNFKGAPASPRDVEQTYEFDVSDRFLTLLPVSQSNSNLSKITSLDGSNVGDPNRTATYRLTNQSTANFSIKVVANTIDNTTLSIYGKRDSSSANSTRTITTYIRVRGTSKGINKEIPVTYTASLTT